MTMTTHPYARTRIRLINTWSDRERKWRIGRLIWSRHGGPGDGTGYSAFLSLGVILRRWALFDLSGAETGTPPRRDHWRLTVLGLSLHHRKAYGGWVS